MTEWLSVATELPDHNGRVLAIMLAVPRPIVIIARYVKERTLNADNVDYFAYHNQDDDYDPTTETYYIQEGWYEVYSLRGINYRVFAPVTHWQPLPSIPHGPEKENAR